MDGVVKDVGSWHADAVHAFGVLLIDAEAPSTDLTGTVRLWQQIGNPAMHCKTYIMY